MRCDALTAMHTRVFVKQRTALHGGMLCYNGWPHDMMDERDGCTVCVVMVMVLVRAWLPPDNSILLTD